MNLKKKLFGPLLVLALSVAGASAWAYQFGSGTMNTDEERNQCLLRVLNADAVAHEAGDVLVWKDGTYDGLEVSTTTSANIRLIAGFVPYGYTLPASDWGWLQTCGYHPAITIAVANSAGDCLGTSTTAEATDVTTTAGACGAVALEATTSSTTVKGLIHRM